MATAPARSRCPWRRWTTPLPNLQSYEVTAGSAATYAAYVVDDGGFYHVRYGMVAADGLAAFDPPIDNLGERRAGFLLATRGAIDRESGKRIRRCRCAR